MKEKLFTVLDFLKPLKRLDQPDRVYEIGGLRDLIKVIREDLVTYGSCNIKYLPNKLQWWLEHKIGLDYTSIAQRSNSVCPGIYSSDYLVKAVIPNYIWCYTFEGSPVYFTTVWCQCTTSPDDYVPKYIKWDSVRKVGKRV